LVAEKRSRRRERRAPAFFSRRWGAERLKPGLPAPPAMSSAAGSGAGLGAQKQYSPCGALREELSFQVPIGVSAVELLARLLREEGGELLLGANREELLRFASRLEERAPDLAYDLAKLLARARSRQVKRFRWWRLAFPPLFAVSRGGRLAALVVRSWPPLERALFPPRSRSGLASFATRAGRRYAVFAFEAGERMVPPLAWLCAAPPEAAYEPYFSRMVRLGALTIVDRVGWLPELEARRDRGEVLALLLRGAALAGAGPVLLFALPRAEAENLERALAWLGLQPQRAGSTKRRELLLLDAGGL